MRKIYSDEVLEWIFFSGKVFGVINPVAPLLGRDSDGFGGLWYMVSVLGRDSDGFGVFGTWFQSWGEVVIVLGFIVYGYFSGASLLFI